MSIALGKNGRQRFLCCETSTALEQRRRVLEHQQFFYSEALIIVEARTLFQLWHVVREGIISCLPNRGAEAKRHPREGEIGRPAADLCIGYRYS